MHSLPLRATFAFALATLAIAGCDGSTSSDSSSDSNSPTPVSNVTVATTWISGGTYYVSGTLYVSARLTLQPGTVVKFASGASILTADAGSIDAQGSKADPVVFTSYSGMNAGAWDGINLAGTVGSSFLHAKFLYGNSISTGSAVVTVDSCEFRHNAGSLDLKNAPATSWVKHSVFVDNGNTLTSDAPPLRISGAMNLDNTNIFSETVSGITVANKYQYVGVYGAVSTAVKWSERTVGIVPDNNLDVSSTLTLDSGVVVKFRSGNGLDASGTGGVVKATGTATSPVVFTAISDDELGDANGDGTASSPAAGSWNTLYLGGSAGSSFLHTTFRYGAGISGGSYKLTIDSSLFKSNSGTLDLGNAPATTTVTHTIFSDNDSTATDVIPALRISSAMSLDTTNTFAGNRYPYIGIFGDVLTPVSWLENWIAFVPENNLNVSSTLTLGTGTVLKLKSGMEIDINDGGSISNYANAYFTAFADDKSGDSNGDVTATTPADGDWEGVYSQESSTWLSWSTIHYAATH